MKDTIKIKKNNKKILNKQTGFQKKIFRAKKNKLSQ